MICMTIVILEFCYFRITDISRIQLSNSTLLSCNIYLYIFNINQPINYEIYIILNLTL